MDDLLERVKAADGPDRELDCKIAYVTNYLVYGMSAPFRSYCDVHDLKWGEVVHHANSYQSILYHNLPRFTASVDAALALVERLLPGSMKRVFDNPDDGSSRAEIVSADGVIGRGDHDTWPLAILAALLTALQASPAAMENTDDDQ